MNHGGKTGIVPVGIGNGGKQALGDEIIVCAVRSTQFLELLTVNRNPLEYEDQQILKVGSFLRLAANPFYGATGVFGGFLTLKTEDDNPPFWVTTMNINWPLSPIGCSPLFSFILTPYHADSFSIFTALTLNSGILAKGSTASALVSTLGGFSPK